MKKKEGWRFNRLVILAIGIALVAAIAAVAYTADLKTQVQEEGVRSWTSPVTKAIVYDNGMDYNGLNASQRDTAYPFDAICADDFQFDVLQRVNDVHWIGGYWDPAEDGFFDWEIKFYDDFGDGTKPGRDFVTYRFADYQINKVDLGNAYFEYSVTLPNPPVVFSPFTKYWISIQGVGIYPPQSGWGYHEDPIQMHECVFKSEYFGYPDWVDGSVAFGTPRDMCFQLTYEDPFPDCKMHFPQYPDLIGWDVNAVAPQVLSDDWQCTGTGKLTDIHFWGSWKNLDGNPWTDDFLTPMPYFYLFIHRNIPADQDTPWSRPGEILWEWWGEFGGVPSEPPTLESWFNPNTGQLICNDHVPYWQYDFFFDQANPPADSFIQYRDSIYWLTVAVESSPPYEWGWKNSRDHFMDDAVWSDNPFAGPWFPLVEPPRCNWFDVQFDATGTPEDLGSSNFYSNGWYFYPEFGWWNMWFYDNPFTYEHLKEIQFEFWVVGMGAVEVAINWSTDMWSLEGVPGRPPLPGDFVDPPIPEEVYIGRQSFGYFQEGGPYTIPLTLTYNPEWISIDFRAETPDYMILNGWIYHECVPTSMDLSFVITGEVEPGTCGDVNNDGIINVGDVVYMVTYLYRGGPAPIPMTCVGDVNNDDIVNVGDVVYLVTYLYRGGPAPNPLCCTPPWAAE